MQGLPQIGDILDETYQIESLLGQGGFGAVYLARQISMDRQVAIKVLVAHAMNVDKMIERFRREVMAVRNLQHPNTIRIYDFRGDREDGLLYYAMEFIKGDTLKDQMKGPLPLDRTIHILRQILKSLSEAHSYGIVHRDLKPANIMIADLHGERDFVKVVDFGIAKIVGQAEEDDDADPLTSAGVLVGTLRYMAPEQITGQGIGPQSDIYALALIGVEMLTGKSVFEGTGRWEVLHKQISDDPVDIPQEVIDSPLGRIFVKALEKKLDRRYTSADEMLQDLNELVQSRGGQVSVPTGLQPVQVPVAAPEQPAPKPADDDATQMVEMAELPQAPAPLPEPQTKPSTPALNPGLSTKPPSHDDTGQFEKPQKKSPIALILVAVLVVAGLGGGAYFLGMQGTTATPDANASAMVEPEAPTTVAAEPAAAEQVEEKWVEVKTPGVVATLFDGETRIDQTPLRVKVEGNEAYVLKADGYIDSPLTLTKDSPASVDVALVANPVPPAEPEVEPPVVEKPAEPEPDRVASKLSEPAAKTKKEPVKTKKQPETKSNDDWVDIKPAEKKPEVPIF